MAFSVRNLSVLAYANGFTLWHYKGSAVHLEEVGQRGFFGSASDLLAVGDIVMVSARDGARLLTVAASHQNEVTLATLS
ncbi:MAG: hypothetical protein JOY71_00105 [Acetobacteraceae bacterium]|nr:hypothetical protein [Acetobacteraceae bacterium]